MATAPTVNTAPQEPSTWRRWLWRVGLRSLRLVLLVYLGILALFMWFENSLIYFPTKYPSGDWDLRGLNVQDAEFTSADGTQLHGWFAPAEDQQAVVLFCHGNAGNVTHRRDVLTLLPKLGASVLVFDYRGY